MISASDGRGHVVVDPEDEPVVRSGEQTDGSREIERELKKVHPRGDSRVIVDDGVTADRRVPPEVAGDLDRVVKDRRDRPALDCFELAPVCQAPRRVPESPGDGGSPDVLRNPVFVQHAVCNMFCIAVLILFSANYSFLMERNYQFDSHGNGIVLALFNGSIAIGTYLVWPLMPRLGMHNSILLGACGGGEQAATSGEATTSTRGVTDTEIVLGNYTDLSGPVAIWGVGITNGARMRFDELNAAGGVHGNGRHVRGDA